MYALRDAFDDANLRDAFERASDGDGVEITPANEWQTNVSTTGADGVRPASNEGTSIVPGASGVKGAWASLGVLSAAHLVYEIEIVVHTATVAGEARNVSIDLGVDNAGGVAFTVLIADLLCGSPGSVQSAHGETRFVFPVRVPAGATVGVRGSSHNVNVTAFRTYVRGKANPTRSDLVVSGTFVRTFGVTGGTVVGTAVVPGQAAEGAWTEIGTLADDIFFVEFGISIDDITMTSQQLDVDIGIGAAAPPPRVVIPNHQVSVNANEVLLKKACGRYAVGNVGDKVWARAQCAGVPDTNVSIAIYAVGG